MARFFYLICLLICLFVCLFWFVFVILLSLAQKPQCYVLKSITTNTRIFFNKLEATDCALASMRFPTLGKGCELRFSLSFGPFVALFACYSEWTDIMNFVFGYYVCHQKDCSLQGQKLFFFRPFNKGITHHVQVFVRKMAGIFGIKTKKRERLALISHLKIPSFVSEEGHSLLWSVKASRVTGVIVVHPDSFSNCLQTFVVF